MKLFEKNINAKNTSMINSLKLNIFCQNYKIDTIFVVHLSCCIYMQCFIYQPKLCDMILAYYIFDVH